MLMALCTASAMGADDRDEIIRLDVDARLDYQRDWNDGHTVSDNTGFEGKYLVIRVDGNITGNLSYSWRQRLNKNHNDGSFFDATDWVYLNYDINRWSLSAGKQVVAIGGWEYDRAPIDLYGCSVFWNNIPCYQIELRQPTGLLIPTVCRFSSAKVRSSVLTTATCMPTT